VNIADPNGRKVDVVDPECPYRGCAAAYILVLLIGICGVWISAYFLFNDSWF
jgi:hypothetical protein